MNTGSAGAPRWNVVTFVVMTACVVLGCSGGDSVWDRVRVTGNVTFQGQSVEDGSVALSPLRSNSGPSAGATIREGAYEIPQDKGPAPGNYVAKVVVVMPPKPAARGTPRGGRKLPDVEQFQREVQITAGDNVIDFKLPPDDVSRTR